MGYKISKSFSNQPGYNATTARHSIGYLVQSVQPIPTQASTFFNLKRACHHQISTTLVSCEQKSIVHPISHPIPFILQSWSCPESAPLSVLDANYSSRLSFSSSSFTQEPIPLVSAINAISKFNSSSRKSVNRCPLRINSDDKSL